MQYIEGMLRLVVSLFLGMIGALGVLLGTHGLYVHFNSLQVFFGGGGVDKLFLSLEVPSECRGVIEWVSSLGMQSWVLPALFLIGGILVLKWSHITTTVSDWLQG